MNIVLFSSQETATGPLILNNVDPRFDHIMNVLQLQTGDTLRVGALNGNIGIGRILESNHDNVIIDTELPEPPPPPSCIQLILAIPRPKALGRIMKTIGEMGVKKVYMIQASRVEKDYWGAHQLKQDYLLQKVYEGLAQARDTIIPEIEFRKRFRPFIEDELPALSKETDQWVAHPHTDNSLPNSFDKPTTIAIGPEGGWIDFELNLLKSIGFSIGHIGTRTLSTVSTIPAILSRGL